MARCGHAASGTGMRKMRDGSVQHRSWLKKERTMENMDSDAKSSTISKVYVVVVTFFRHNPRRFP